MGGCCSLDPCLQLALTVRTVLGFKSELSIQKHAFDILIRISPIFYQDMSRFEIDLFCFCPSSLVVYNFHAPTSTHAHLLKQNGSNIYHIKTWRDMIILRLLKFVKKNKILEFLARCLNLSFVGNDQRKAGTLPGRLKIVVLRYVVGLMVGWSEISNWPPRIVSVFIQVALLFILSANLLPSTEVILFLVVCSSWLLVTTSLRPHLQFILR